MSLQKQTNQKIQNQDALTNERIKINAVEIPVLTTTFLAENENSTVNNPSKRHTSVSNLSKKLPNSSADAVGWSDEELEASFIAYQEMQTKVRNKDTFTKTSYYKELSDRFDRTTKAFEFRMQNISFVLSLMGRPWLQGLKPAKNVGAHIAAKIEAIIHKIEGNQFPLVTTFEIETKLEMAKNDLALPPGQSSPHKIISAITQISRDPKVKAWVLKNSGNSCEVCKKDAPFFSNDGTPFLEVHHLRRLADGGTDTITNVVAVCPNCHRELHFGAKNNELLKNLYRTINRLIAEN